MFRKNKLIIAFAVSLACILTPEASPQLVQLSLSLSKDTIKLGEQCELRVDLKIQPDVKIVSFPLADSLGKEIEWVDNDSDTLIHQGNRNIIITSFTPGVHRIPPIPLIFSWNDSTKTILSPALYLTVLSPQVIEQQGIKDIKPLMNLPLTLREILPYVVLSVILLFGIYLIVRHLLKRKSGNLSEESEGLLIPAHIMAINELEKLKVEKLWQNGQYKEFYSRLSDILRTYLERRFFITALEYVSSETLTEFRKFYNPDEIVYEMLENILTTADMVKFAKAEPLPPVNQGNLDNAFLFVEQTKLEEVTSIDEKRDELADSRSSGQSNSETV